jgi:hypothetical protein
MGVHPANPQNASNAVTALVLGILGIVLCPLLGPVAWSLGHKAEQEVDASAGTLGGRGLATAGKVLGIIGTLLIVLVVVVIVFAYALGGGADTALTPTPRA